MKRIYLNLKRFDIPKNQGGVNDIATADSYAKSVVSQIESGIKDINDIFFAVFMPEAYLIDSAKSSNKLAIGCQGVHRADVSVGGNFGAFTSLRTARSAKFDGATQVLIGHCEERNNLKEIIKLGGGSNLDAVNEILNKEIACAVSEGLQVLYCIGETADEQSNKYEVLRNQLAIGLNGIDLSKVCIAYEPVWAIGPGKIPPDSAYITDIVKFIKSVVDVPVVYGGGLKTENAPELAKIPQLDGGLIALTTFGKDFGFSVENYLKIVNTYRDNLQ